jgi:hypothetical protein
MQEKRLKRWMKEYLSEKGLNIDNWRYLQSTPDKLVIIHKHSLQPREVKIMNTTQFTRITNS